MAVNKKQTQIIKWKEANKIKDRIRNAKPRTKDIRREERKILQENKSLTKKQRKALREGEEVSKDGINKVNNFFMILNTLKITYKLVNFDVDPIIAHGKPVIHKD